MSGFEVIGLILALYPAIVDTVNYCKKVRSGDIIHDLLEDVRAEKVIFCGSIQRLCVAQVSGTHVSEIIKPGSEAFALWRQSSFLDALLASHAAEATASILETLKSMNAELEKVHLELGKISPSSVDFKARLKTTFFALLSGQDASDLKRRLKKIHKLNQRLSQLIASRPQHRYPRTGGSDANLWCKSCAGFATGVFQAVENHYRCSCQRGHATKLQVPSLPYPKSDPGNGPKPILELLFSVDDETVLERHSREKRDSVSISRSVLSSETSVSSSKSQGSECDNSQGDYSLSYIPSTNSLASSMTLVSNPKCYRLAVTECGMDRSDEIADICTTVRDLAQVSEPPFKLQTLGILRGGSVNYELQSPRPVGDGDSKAILSLDDIFTGDQKRLARRCRISTALRLAWAITQLHQTPWITPSWTWSDFSAIANQQRGQIDEGLFITKYFSSIHNADVPITTDAGNAASPLSIAIGEPVIARLGYALIELASGKRLASLQDSNGPTSTDKDLQDLLTARHLLDNDYIRDEECQAYSDVVHACLYQQVQRDGGLGLKKLRSRDALFERDLTQAIVQPLYNIYRREWGSSPTAVLAC